jgi:sulfide:quinone oxidoreductase
MEHHDVLVVGGGNGGISAAAKLLRDGFEDVAVVSPSPVHRYRPLLNYVGAGEAAMADLERPQRDVIPDGCRWIQDAVEAVDPVARTVRTRSGSTIGWSTLVLSPGMVEDWDATPGLQAAYAQGWVASTYVPGSTPQVWPRLRSLRTGSVVFTVPPEPAPSAGTALKPLFMACDHWRRTGVLRDLRITLVLPGPTSVAVPEADGILDDLYASNGVEVLRQARVESVDPERHDITVTSSTGRRVLAHVDFAHAVPHYRAPRWIADSGLAVDDAAGLVDIDPTTLRHRQHGSIWAIGDAAYLATPSSGGGLRHQVGVLAKNLAAARDGGKMHEYDGYTVVPITVSKRRLLLVEVDRDGNLTPSVPFVDPIPPRRATWLFDRYALPSIYWRRLLRGKV